MKFWLMSYFPRSKDNKPLNSSDLEGHLPLGPRDGRAGINGQGMGEGEDREAAAHLETAVKRGSRGRCLALG